MSIILSSTTDKVQVVTSSTADIHFTTMYEVADKTSSPMVVKDADNKVGLITTATTTDISGSPAAANDRWAVQLELQNRHASASNDLTVQLVKAGGTARDLIKVTLFAGWKLARDANGTWFVYDDKGGVIMSSNAASDTVAGLIQVAVQSDMESASSTILAVTPGRQHFHPGHPKCWGMATVASNVPTLQVSYNVTSITDTATGQLTVTINNDFSASNYCVVTGSRLTATTYAEANDRKIYVRFGTQAAGSLILDCIDTTTTTMLAKDPDAWNWCMLGDL